MVVDTKRIRLIMKIILIINNCGDMVADTDNVDLMIPTELYMKQNRTES